jgi:predicted RNA polymerase sigma factor
MVIEANRTIEAVWPVKLGRGHEARIEFERAAALTRNDAERTLLLERAPTAERQCEVP